MDRHEFEVNRRVRGAVKSLRLILRDWHLLLVAAVLQAAIVALNHDFYRFMHRERGGWFTLAVIPLHLLYFFTSGLSVVAGQMLHRFSGEPSPSAVTVELSQRGLMTWPPVPVRPRISPWHILKGTGNP